MKWIINRGHKAKGKVICSKKTCPSCTKSVWEPWGDVYRYCPHCGAESNKEGVPS